MYRRTIQAVIMLVNLSVTRETWVFCFALINNDQRTAMLQRRVKFYHVNRVAEIGEEMVVLTC